MLNMKRWMGGVTPKKETEQPNITNFRTEAVNERVSVY